MDLGLTGKRALVTGASKGTGLAITSALVAEGAQVVAGSRSVSEELRFGPRGIRVNAVSPGPVSTELWLGDHGVAATVAAAQGGDAHNVADQQAGRAATGRFTEPHQVADLVVLLASDRAGNVTGSDFVIDGGLVETL